MRSCIYILCLISMQLSAQTGIIWEEPIMITDGLSGYNHPRIVLDSDENPVVIWGDDEDSHLSRKVGIYFTAPQMLDPMGMSIFTASWAGPDITSKGDTIYVVFKENPEDAAPVYCITSYDGGETFSAPVIVDGMIGENVSRFPSVTVDADGNPLVAFMKLDADFLNAEYVVAKSDDYGNSFNMDVMASGFSGGEVCDCCPVGITSNDNFVTTLYRDNLDNLRNSWAGISSDGGNTFNMGLQIDQTDWTVFACPASGPDGIIINDNLYSVFMSAGEGDSRVYFSTSSLTELTDEPDKRVSAEIEGLSIQNYPRIASYGNAVAIVWKQVANANSVIPISFTNDISSGFPLDYDTVANLDFYGLENADVAVSSNKVYVVWQDDYNNAVMYREGLYVTPVIVDQIFVENDIKIFPNPTGSFIHINSKIEISSSILYDIHNKQVKNIINGGKTTFSIPVNELASGIYFLKLIDINGKTHTEKVIVE